MANSYYTKVQTFIDGQILYAVDLNDELDAIVAGLDRFPTPVVTNGEGFSDPCKVGVATDPAHAVRLDQLQTWTSNIDAGGFKLTNLAAGTDPGDAVRFDQLTGGGVPGGAGGTTSSGSTSTDSTTSIALDATQTASHCIALNTTPIAPLIDGSVTIDDATTFTTAGVQFWLYNSGLSAWALRNNGGDMLAWFRPRQGATVTLCDNATSDGVWRPIGDYDHLSKPQAITDAAGSVFQFSACSLDATRLLHLYVVDAGGSTFDVKARVITRTADVIAYGAETTIESGIIQADSDIRSTACCLLDTDKVLACWIEAATVNDGEGFCSVLTLSGNAITATTTPEAIGTDSVNGVEQITACQIDTDRALVVYDRKKSLTRAVYAQVVTATGTALAFGVTDDGVWPFAQFDDQHESLEVQKIDTDKAVVAGTMVGKAYAQVITIATDVPTLVNTESEVFSDSQTSTYSISIAILDTDTFVAACFHGSGTREYIPVLVACNLDGSDNVVVAHTTDVDRSASNTTGYTGEITFPRVQVVKTGTPNAVAMVFPSNEVYRRFIGVRAFYDTTQFHFTRPEILNNTVQYEAAEQDNAFCLGQFTGDGGDKLVLCYREDSTGMSAMHIEVAK